MKHSVTLGQYKASCLSAFVPILSVFSVIRHRCVHVCPSADRTCWERTISAFMMLGWSHHVVSHSKVHYSYSRIQCARKSYRQFEVVIIFSFLEIHSYSTKKDYGSDLFIHRNGGWRASERSIHALTLGYSAGQINIYSQQTGWKESRGYFVPKYKQDSYPRGWSSLAHNCISSPCVKHWKLRTRTEKTRRRQWCACMTAPYAERKAAKTCLQRSKTM